MSHLPAYVGGLFLVAIIPFCLVPALVIALLTHIHLNGLAMFVIIALCVLFGLWAAVRHAVLAAAVRAVRQTGIGRIVGESLLRHMPADGMVASSRLHRTTLRPRLRASAAVIGHRQHGRDETAPPSWLALRVRSRLVREASGVVCEKALAQADTAGIIDLTVVKQYLAGNMDRLLSERLRFRQALQTSGDLVALILLACLLVFGLHETWPAE
jgi:hypothetical protein